MKTKYWGIALAITLLALPITAFGQEENTTETATSIEEASEEARQEIQAPSNPTDSRVEKLEVTGSRIKRINIEGPSPVLSLDREYLERSGLNSVADVLRDSTVAATGVIRETSGNSNAGSATTGLRGFGADKILVLLNGRRLPKIGGDNSVDLNLIPFQALERVDILKDGASAIYGSDALAGVINFITRKDFDGSSVMVRYSTPEEAGGGQKRDISAVYGDNFDRGNFMAIYQYRSNKELKDADREWSRGGFSAIGSPGSYRPATQDPNDEWEPAPNCPPDQIIGSTDPDKDQYCGFDYTPYSWALPAIEQHSMVLTGGYDLNESLKLYSNLLYTRRLSPWQYAPAPDRFYNGGGKNYAIPNAVATGPGWSLPGLGANDADVYYRLVNELGPRSNRVETDSYGGTVGVKGYIGDTWEWDGSVTYGGANTYSRGFSGYADKSVLYSLMLDGTLRPFDPTGTGNADAARHVAEQWIDSSLTLAQWETTGEITSVGSGILSAALGISGAWEEFEERVDSVTQAGDLYGGSGSRGKGSRNFQAFFTELSLAFKRFEVVLAGRYDQFSDFGSTINPKLAMRYTPLNSVMLRGSIGTGFKAPTLNELYASQGYGFPWYTDITRCAETGSTYDCAEQQYQTLSGGNPNLKEETSLSYNVGTLIQPTRDLSFSLDYWHTEINDAIGIDYNDLMLAEQQLGNAALQAQGANVVRTGGKLVEVIAPSLNLSQQKASGLEFSADWQFHIGGIRINPHIDHSHMLSYLEEPFPGMGLISKLGERGRPRWRNTSYVTVGFLTDHSVRFTARTIAGQFKIKHTSDRSDQRRLPNYTEYDLNYRYNAFWNAEIVFGVRNLFGTDRPLDQTGGFTSRLNTDLYDQLGRTFYLGYTQNF